jgi:hypothetical protein
VTEEKGKVEKLNLKLASENKKLELLVNSLKAENTEY